VSTAVGPPPVTHISRNPDITIRGIIDPGSMRPQIFIEVGVVIVVAVWLRVGRPWRRGSFLIIRNIIDTTCQQDGQKYKDG
jgi:hypothetical protein